jgi:hypothetical protein
MIDAIGIWRILMMEDCACRDMGRGVAWRQRALGDPIMSFPIPICVGIPFVAQEVVSYGVA